MKSVAKVAKNELKEQWYLVDAKAKRIGVLASKVAALLMGKNDIKARRNLKPVNHVVIINSKEIDFTAKRGLTKFYKSYSGFPGGLKFTSLEEMHKKNPSYSIENAIKGMLPQNKMADVMMANLRVFEDAKHSHEAQKPITVNI